MPSFNIVDETKRVPQRLSRERSNRIKRYGPLPSNTSCACVYKTGIRRVRREINTNNFLQNYFEQRFGDDFLRYECGDTNINVNNTRSASSSIVAPHVHGDTASVHNINGNTSKNKSVTASSSSLTTTVAAAQNFTQVLHSTFPFPNSVESHRTPSKDAMSSSSSANFSNRSITNMTKPKSKKKNVGSKKQGKMNSSHLSLKMNETTSIVSTSQSMELLSPLQEDISSLCPDKRSTASSIVSPSGQVFTPPSMNHTIVESIEFESMNNRDHSSNREMTTNSSMVAPQPLTFQTKMTAETNLFTPHVVAATVDPHHHHTASTSMMYVSPLTSSNTCLTSSTGPTVPSTFHTPCNVATTTPNSLKSKLSMVPCTTPNDQQQYYSRCLPSVNPSTNQEALSLIHESQDSSCKATIVCEGGSVHIQWGDQFFRTLFDLLNKQQ
ncbi:hypothetical protein C9374_011259 [Naegleria lovaniensis]|uniref:Uncharacterized protein n=1 Tax=Naegleria lovaniensis TaxID=51637 RepID=A0AA88GXT9_NAELO|nr:uncharacterized protein C9374_011259 [Naegleria lovaniensis]KAG2392534.1 hypothetical protein C9374_011259 [Naegleria lovaniensis]